MIQDGFEMNDASTIIGQELQGDNVTHIQTDTLMEGGSVNIGEQTIVQGGSKDMQELLTTVDFDNDKDQVSNAEEAKNDYGSIGYESFSGTYDSSDSSVKVSTKHVKETSKKKFTIPSDEDSDEEDSAYESDGSKSSNSHFSQTSID